jgi:hypothetical protein
MTAQMTQKLRDVFDSMFGINKGSDKGDIDVADHNIVLAPAEFDMNEKDHSVLVAVVKDNSNNPVSGSKVEFAIVDTNIVTLERSDDKTDANGMVVMEIRGNKAGKTNILATTEIGNKTEYSSSSVNVTSSRTTEKVKDEKSTEKAVSNVDFRPVDG